MNGWVHWGGWTGRFDLLPLLDRLNTSMITHLMIEGGAQVISSFLNTPKNTVDLLIVTVAPVLLGSDGVEIAHVCAHCLGD